MVKKIKAHIVKILLWSQKYTKADMVYIAQRGFWVLLGQSLNSVFSLVLLVAFANLLPKETYGLYRYILSIAGILNIFTLSGMNSAVTRAVARGEEGVLQQSVRYQLVWNCMMLVAFWVLGTYYVIHDDSLLAISFFVLGIFVPSTLAFNTYGPYLEGKKQFQLSNVLATLSTLTYSIGMLVILFLTDAVVWIVAVYAVSTFIPSFLFYVYTVRRFKPSAQGDTTDTLKFGRELTYLRFIDPILSNIDKVILAHFWGPAQLATYSLATAIPNRVVLLIKSWVGIGFPKFATKEPAEINTVFYRRILQGMALGSLAAALYVLVAPYLFTYILPQYMDGLFYSQLLAATFITAIPNRYISHLFGSQRLSRLLFKRTLIQGVINITLYVILGTTQGLFGLVIAAITISVMSLCINIFMWKTHTASKDE